MNSRIRILKRILFFTLIVIFLFFIWKISVSGGITPMEQITKDGWFEAKNSPLRGIRMYVESMTTGGVGERPEFTVWITDEAGQTLWEKTYYNRTSNHGEMVILEEYERGEGIEEIKNGRFQIHNTLSEDPSIRVTHKIMSYDGSYAFCYGMCVMFALLFLIIILVVTMKQSGKYQLAVNYFLTLVLMGILFSIIMPPLTVPDEESHFLRAYQLASKMMFQDESDAYGNKIMRQTDIDSITYLHSASSIGRWYATFGDSVDVNEKAAYGGRSSVSETTPDYSYLFSALGIMLARAFRMNGHWLLLMGRFFNLVGVALIMAAALHLVPFGKKFFCVFGLLPEVVYLAASYSYDALNLALCFLAFAYFFCCIADEKQVGWKQLMVFLGIIAVLTPIKLVYVTLIGLLLLIPSNQLKINRRVIAGIGAAVVLGMSIFLFLRLEDIVVLFQGLDYNTEEVHVSLKYMLENPKNVIFVFLNNLMCNFDYYINSMAGEFVGRDRFEMLLDIAYLPQWMMMVIGILLAMGIYTERKANLQIWKKMWIGVIATGSALLIWLSIYLANNTVDMNVIHGVQGRYFLPILMLLPTLFGRRTDQVQTVQQEAHDKLTPNGYVILAAGINIIAIFVQLQHLTMDYYA